MKILEKLLAARNNRERKPYDHSIPPAVRDFYANIDPVIREWNEYVKSTSSAGTPIDELSPDQKALNEDQKWKAFFVFIYGEFNPEAQKYFPHTSRLAEKWAKDVKLVFFSSLEPGKRIQAHHGRNHGVIRAQIGIDIKQPDKTGLRVSDKIVQLKDKELFIFDDTFEHEAWNEGAHYRTVLIIDSCKKFPYLYDLINRWQLRKMKGTSYVQTALAKWKNTNLK